MKVFPKPATQEHHRQKASAFARQASLFAAMENGDPAKGKSRRKKSFVMDSTITAMVKRTKAVNVLKVRQSRVVQRRALVKRVRGLVTETDNGGRV